MLGPLPATAFIDGGGGGLPLTKPGLCCIGAASLCCVVEMNAVRRGWKVVVGLAVPC